MSKKKDNSMVEWFERWEENIKGHPKKKAKISSEEWDKLSPKEKMAFIRKNRSSQFKEDSEK